MFIHLHVHSAYSLLNSSCKIESLVKKASNLGYKALAITDENVMYGVIPFFKECKKNGIKPIIGLSLSIQSNEKESGEESYPLVLLAETNQGYKNLLVLSSLIQTKYKTGVPLEWLKKYKNDLIAISPYKGEISQLLANDKIEEAKSVAKVFGELFEGDFFLAFENHLLKGENNVNQLLDRLCKELNIQTVVSNHVHYIEKDDSLAHDCLSAIKHGVQISESHSEKLKNNEYYLKSESQMKELFDDSKEEAFKNTVWIANRCSVEIELGNQVLPKYPLPKDENSSSAYLRKLCIKGAKSRFTNWTIEIEDRLEYELSIIQKMNFSDYFLIVWDFMKFAHDKGILTGPGRGSAAGSLVAYVLHITDVDPIKHELLFERFLNPERVSMPDIDIDFPDTERDHVISYVAKKYGSSHVAQIITFGTLAARASIRDVGRVMGFESKEIDHITKQISTRPGIQLLDAIKESDVLKKMIEESEKVKKLIKIALTIEGLPRHASTHAAGVIISDRPLTHSVPIQEGHNGIYLTQYPMETLEEVGLLKMDFLGLRNLTLIQNITRMINKTDPHFSLDHIPFHDDNTFHLLSLGDTSGVFQLESDGMRQVLQKLKPSEFEDIVAVNALYRPGPMENIPDYINRKHGKEKVEYLHEDLKTILEKTNGVIVYQEQIMLIASKMAGFSLGEADILRRAVSKKKKDILDKERKHFIEGCLSKGYDYKTADKIYDLIVRFANYGFNRSHAVAYSIIAYQLAYLKANYPLYFMTAILTSVIGNDERIGNYIREAKKKNMEILPPSINRSIYSFKIENGSIRFSLACIKNVGMTAIKEIIEHRREQKFTGLFDFCSRVSSKIINRRVMESLVLSGSFDEFGKDRASLLANLDLAIEYSELVGEDQDGLFLGDDLIPKPQYIEVDPLNTPEKLKYEKEVLGFFLSSHPMEEYHHLLKQTNLKKVNQLHELSPKATIDVCCYILKLKTIQTKKGDQMAFLTGSDETGEIEIVVFPNVYKLYQLLLQKEQFIYIKGVIDERQGNRQLIANDMLPIKIVMKSIQQVLYLKVNSDKESLFKVKEVLKKNSGFTAVNIYYPDQKQTIRLSKEWNVNTTEECINRLKRLLGDKNVVLKPNSLQ